MRRILPFCVGLLLFLPALSPAVSIPVDDRLQLDFTLAGERWVFSREAPDFLVEKTVGEIRDELLKQKKDPGEEAILTAARKRIAANEGFIFNPRTRAYLLIDFSPLRPGEDPPSSKTVALSARYAGEGLLEEEGFSEVTQKSAASSLSGAETAFRIDARYRRLGKPEVFVGIVGFAPPCWFYLYYTDPLADPGDLAEMEGVLRSMKVSPNPDR